MLGVGAFGTVWLATTRESGRRVAMKIVERKRQVRRSRRASEGLGGPRMASDCLGVSSEGLLMAQVVLLLERLASGLMTSDDL
jgi:hypothetical protein